MRDWIDRNVPKLESLEDRVEKLEGEVIMLTKLVESLIAHTKYAKN